MQRTLLALVVLLSATFLSNPAFAGPSSAQEVAESYFKSFAAHDSTAMNLLYEDATEGVFQDPVFGALRTNETRAMWEMLLQSPKNFSVKYGIQSVVGNVVTVRWIARYDYSQTGQRVKNVATTALKIENGKIVRQVDSFDICRWFSMAMPVDKAAMLCLNPDLFRGGIRAALNAYMSKHGEAGARSQP